MCRQPIPNASSQSSVSFSLRQNGSDPPFLCISTRPNPIAVHRLARFGQGRLSPSAKRRCDCSSPDPAIPSTHPNETHTRWLRVCAPTFFLCSLSR